MSEASQRPELPISSALAEAGQGPQAGAESLAELMSRDPEGYQKQDLQRVVEALRADRARREKAAEDASARGATKTPRSVSPKATGPQSAAISSDDAGGL